ncbi:MAG: caspase family protein, partial [Ginsengibacter sp.]
MLLTCFIFSLSAFSQSKHALIFAIGNYPQVDGGWPTISSLRDVGFIETALKKQDFRDIKIVSDAQATVKGISNALDDLIERVKPGDVVVIHFSSHGEQIEDDNGDETDGLDECIVTYNARLPRGVESLSKEEYDKLQANYYRDDLFGSYIDKLRARLGKDGDVVVFMDLCHSGTGTRGIAK